MPDSFERIAIARVEASEEGVVSHVREASATPRCADRTTESRLAATELPAAHR